MLKISDFLKTEYVRPAVATKYREMLEEVLAQADDETRNEAEMAFYQEQCKQINIELAKIQREGEQLCYSGYKVNTLRAYKDAGQHPAFGFDDRAICCTPELLAELWTAVGLIMRQHAHNLTIYQGYDEYEEKFVDLAPVLDEIGGHIEFKRPEFIITIPDGYYSLVTRERTLHGVERDYKALENHLRLLQK